MKTSEHLSKIELFKFSSGLLSEQKIVIAGRHLLGCEDCRKALPAPTPDRLYSVLTGGENAGDKDSGRSVWTSAFNSFDPINLVWSGGALLIILGFAFLFWMNFQSTETGKSKKELASVHQQETKIIPRPNSDNDGKNSVLPPAMEKQDPGPAEVKRTSDGSGKIFQEKASKPKERYLNRKKENSIEKKVNKISATRGADKSLPECNESNLDLSFQSKDDEILLNWKKVPEAIKYHLFIADEDEILIDEYETVSETSYALTQTLDPEKTYSWKILVTLKNGETLVAKSRKFTFRDMQVGELKQNRQKTDARCSEKIKSEK
jgi:hypothetical protein